MNGAEALFDVEVDCVEGTALGNLEALQAILGDELVSYAIEGVGLRSHVIPSAVYQKNSDDKHL